MTRVKSHYHQAYKNPAVSHHAHHRLHLPSPYYELPYYAQPDFLRLHPNATYVVAYLLLIARRLPPSTYKYHGQRVYKVFSHPDKPLPSGCGSVGSDCHNDHSVRASPHDQSLYRSFRPAQTDIHYHHKHVLSHFLQNQNRLFL